MNNIHVKYLVLDRKIKKLVSIMRDAIENLVELDYIRVFINFKQIFCYQKSSHFSPNLL